jgi:hypothetical protein
LGKEFEVHFDDQLNMSREGPLADCINCVSVGWHKGSLELYKEE